VKKPGPSRNFVDRRGRAETKAELRDVGDKGEYGPIMAELYRQAEERLRKQRKRRKAKAGASKTKVDSDRLVQELQVQQIELEMQNIELQEGRSRMEALLDKYTDLYDFAPVGYLSLDDRGQILEINLTGALLLGAGRARLRQRPLWPFIAVSSRSIFSAFLAQVLTGAGKKNCEVELRRNDGKLFWADWHGRSAGSRKGRSKWCRMVLTDITARKQAEEAQRRLEALATSNENLKREMTRRQAVQETLKHSEQHQKQLLKQSRDMQEQLRHLSRQVLWAQEEERKRISRELHDVVAQTLTGINLRLATLRKEAGLSPRHFTRHIIRTQKLVEKSVNLVHQFARELRPAVLDDLGLIPALHTFMKNFTTQSGIHTHLTAFAGVEQLDATRRTVLFRVAQEALTNVFRHAHASRVSVSLEKKPDGLRMKIQDDGQSFAVDEVLKRKGPRRLGLLGMKERLEMVGGRFSVVSTRGAGTTIETWIPVVKGWKKVSPVKRPKIQRKKL
jgi:PAS domain S-box-containing protein